MTDPAFAVETENLGKQYKKVEALSDLNLQVKTGEIFALLGPNGAGKTTWISIVTGLAKATRGRVSVFGRDIREHSVWARAQIGLVPQEINFDPFFTPREVLRFQLGYYGRSVDEARIEEVLSALDLYGKADVNARELSGGMKRRLLIAKALVHRPRIVFLDEPTAGVDVALRHDLWAYVRKLQGEGTTVVLTTHYLEEAEALAERVAVIDKGKLVALERPHTLLQQHGQKRIRLQFDDAIAPSESALPEAEWSSDRKQVTVPLTLMPLDQLFKKVATLPARLLEIRTEEPSLEQVFIKLTRGKK